jgi:hypothetical protein
MPASIQNVEELVTHMLEAMEADAERLNASPEDVVSAAMTLTLRTIKVTKTMHCDMKDLKAAVGLLLLECQDDETHSVQ